MEEAASPIIIQTNTDSKKSSIFPGVPSSLPKIIFVALILIIAAELVWGIWYILKPAAPTYMAEAYGIQIEASKAEAMITLSAPEKEVKVGDAVPVQINIKATGSNTYGTDLVIKYDPAVLTLQGTPNSIFVKGTLYPDYLGQESASGQFRVSGISNSHSGIETDELFGTLNFRALKQGSASITVEFDEGKTDDSNVINDEGQDILKSVTNLNINVL